MDWARANDYVVFTHHLDFGAMLALTQAESPSVIQIRTQDVTPTHLEKAVIDILRKNESVLEAKALIVIDEGRSRVGFYRYAETLDPLREKMAYTSVSLCVACSAFPNPIIS
jgi:hypothetical protein